MRLFATLLVLTTMSSPGLAQDWEVGRGVTTARLSAEGWQLVGTASIPGDEGGAVVTFWQGLHQGSPVTARCITSFAPDFRTTVEVCAQPVLKDNR